MHKEESNRTGGIFSLDRNSIYDRCIKNSRYGQAHRIGEFRIKQKIHLISQRIAFWIFENNSEEAFIPSKEYEAICDNVISEISDGNEDLKKDFLIGNYFKLIKHCEGMETQELHFIHRSIYEYFVVVYFFESIRKMESEEEAAGKLGELLKYGRLSKQILEFIKYKFDSMKEHNLPNIIKEILNIMLQDGMTYHTKERYKNVIEREMYIFSNMLDVVCLWNPKLGKFDNIVFYLQHNYLDMLNLRGAYLRGADLRGADLRGANLNGADLEGIDLRGADLKGAYLSEADLKGVYLRGADLEGADLRGADLRRADLAGANLRGANLSKANLIAVNLINVYLVGADLRGADLEKADLLGANLSETIFNENQVDLLCKEYDLTESEVFISETKEILSYKRYCNCSAALMQR